jgi:signal recognition particle subunit SRP54
VVSKILGMGDVLTLIEKAEAAFDEEKAKELEKDCKDSFTWRISRSTSEIRKMGLLSRFCR